MKTIRIISRIFVGFVFIFSGFVKGVDPMGSAYKFVDYFEAFHMLFLSPLAIPLAMILSTIEMVIGINLLLGIRMKTTAWALLFFMSFFTVLTFILALYNPVTDCGCFGDAVVITNWQTFWKNIILFLPTIIIFISREKYIPLYPKTTEWILTGVLILFGISISTYCYRNLPVIDFRPYKVGTSIPEKMVIPPGMPTDEYETILTYEKNGVKKEFNMKNFPWQDTTWHWVETKQNLIKKGYTPPIHDFTITTLDGNDITSQVLSDQGYSFLLISPELSEANSDALIAADSIASECKNKNCNFYCLTSSPMKDITQTKNNLNPEFSFYLTDNITLKTIIRSNPGLVLIKDGVILGKWSYKNFPTKKMLQKDYLQLVLNTYRQRWEKLRVIAIFGLFFLAISLFHIIRKHFTDNDHEVTSKSKD